MTLPNPPKSHILSRSPALAALCTTLCAAIHITSLLGQMGCPSPSSSLFICEVKASQDMEYVVAQQSVNGGCHRVRIQESDLTNLDDLLAGQYYEQIELIDNPLLTDVSALGHIYQTGDIIFDRMPLGEIYTLQRDTEAIGYINIIMKNMDTRIVNIDIPEGAKMTGIQLSSMPNLSELNLPSHSLDLVVLSVVETGVQSISLEQLPKLPFLVLTNNPNLSIQPIQAFLDTLPENERPEFTHCGNADDEACPPPPEEPEATFELDQ